MINPRVTATSIHMFKDLYGILSIRAAASEEQSGNAKNNQYLYTVSHETLPVSNLM
jgi:hypothetical protein